MTTVSMLLEANADTEATDTQGETPLSLAAANGREDVVRALLDKNAKVDARGHISGRTPLLWAVKNRHTAVASLLLDRGADVKTKDASTNPSSFGMTPLSWAARNGDEVITALLLDKWAIIEAADGHRQQHPLWLAIKSGHHSVVHRLLDHGACTVEFWRQLGGKALRTAAGLAEASVLELLLRFEQGVPNGIHPHWFSNDPTYLLSKSRCRSEAVVRVLLNLHAEPNGHDNIQHRPLHYAAAAGNTAIIRLLLDRGAEIQRRNESWWTPLHLAVKYGHTDTVETLLLRGADPAVITTFELAHVSGNQDIIQLLDKALQTRGQRVS